MALPQCLTCVRDLVIQHQLVEDLVQMYLRQLDVLSYNPSISPRLGTTLCRVLSLAPLVASSLGFLEQRVRRISWRILLNQETLGVLNWGALVLQLPLGGLFHSGNFGQKTPSSLPPILPLYTGSYWRLEPQPGRLD